MNSEQLTLFKFISTLMCFFAAALYGLTDMEPPSYKIAGYIYKYFGKHFFITFLLVMGTLFLFWLIKDFRKEK